MMDAVKHPPGGWAHRLIEGTRKTPINIMLISMIGAWKPYHAHFIPTTPAQYAPRIDAEGNAWVTMVHEGRMMVECLGPIEDVNDNFRRLADEHKLNDADRIAMFNALRAWFATDARAKSEDEK